MDTLTHTLSGAVLGRVLARPARPGRPAALGAAPAMLAGAAAAAFPDIDFVLGYVSELAYLRGHRGVTHSLLLAPLWALLLAGLMAMLARRSDRRWRAFYPLVLGGLLIHIAGDFITQFGTMMLAPFSDWRFGLGAVFIIDLVFSGILLGGLLASALWRRSRLPATISLVLLVGWVGVCLLGRSEALQAGRDYAAAHGLSIVELDAAPRPASPFNWTVVLFDGRDYHYAHLNTRRRVALEAGPQDHFIRRYSAPYQPVATAAWQRRARFGNGGEEALARRVWEAPAFAFYRWFSMFPVLEEVTTGPDGLACAAFRDLRFETPPRANQPFRYGLCEGVGGGWRLYGLSAEGRRWIALEGGAQAAQ